MTANVSLVVSAVTANVSLKGVPEGVHGSATLEKKKTVKNATYLRTNKGHTSRVALRGTFVGTLLVVHVLSACCRAAPDALAVMVDFVTRTTVAFLSRQAKGC